MGARYWKSLLVAALACLALASQASAQVWGNAAYDRGYREGVQQGERDARDNHTYSIEGSRIYRDGDRGYERRDGSRDSYRNEFRRGFSVGYREGFDRFRGGVRDDRWGRDVRWGQGQGPGPRDRRGYQEPAFARGYSDGWQQGLEDGRDRDRYDAVRHGDYKDADNGYERGYGSKDAYKNNYRSGFRQGYEEGYRSGTRTARR
jgi:flagellar biosynthesis/type III secretory pathway protein FliH